ncbi:MAG: NAD(P)-binding protein [Thermoleophilaceae bacterium]
MGRGAHRVAIVGAGPIGLEAALAASARGLDFTVYEAAESVGGYVRRWGHVRAFTPWDMAVSPRARSALAAAGASVPVGDHLPTGDELAAELLEPLAGLPALAGRVRAGTRVTAIGREGLLKHEEIGSPERAARPFRLLLTLPDGSEAIAHAEMVLDCSGTYGSPNRLGDGGISALGESALEDRIERWMPLLEADPGRWAGRTILLTGSGHSAQTAARDLARFARDAPETRIIWAIRSRDPTWGAVEDDPLPDRAALNRAAAEIAGGASPAIETRLGHVTERLERRDGRVAVTLRNGEAGRVIVDRVLALNGGVGDASLYRQLQVHECYATCGPINLAAALLGEAGGDCLSQPTPGPETLANPEPGFFILGAKSYGRNGQFLMRNGWQQVDDVLAPRRP